MLNAVKFCVNYYCTQYLLNKIDFTFQKHLPTKNFPNTTIEFIFIAKMLNQSLQSFKVKSIALSKLLSSSF